MAELLTPAWWVDRLSKRLATERFAMQTFEDYYRGNHPLPDVRDELRVPYRRLLSMSPTNFMRLVVDATEERLNVTGFRFSDSGADLDAWRIWQANAMDAESQLNHREALVKSRGYVIVWPSDDPSTPTITVEDPMSVVVEYEPGNRRRRAAALKMWHDDWTGWRMATLYLPDSIHKFVYDNRHVSGPSWQPREVPGEQAPLRNPFGLVPVVAFPNRPDTYGYGESELSDVTNSQDRVNKIIFDRMMAAEFTSFKQRWATGVDIPVDPTTGEPVEPFEVAVQRLLINENPEGKFGEFDQTDLAPYLDAADQDLKFIASATRTPPHYLNTSADRLSGESIKSAETGLVAKVRRKQRHFGEAWEEVMRLAFTVMGDARAGYQSAETIWADPESRTESEHADAVGKLRTMLEIPRESAWEEYGFSPTQIERLKRQAAAEALTGVGVDVTSLFADDDEQV
jgi:hypothetical protein